jgi:hypothetical protein
MYMKKIAVIFLSCFFGAISMASELTVSAGAPAGSDSVEFSRTTLPAAAPHSGLESLEWRLTRYRDASGQWLPVLPDAPVTARRP